MGWAYVLTIAGGVISIVLSGMPNLLQSLLQRSNLRHQAKHPPPSIHSHLSSPWYPLDTSMLLNGSAVSSRVRRRPHSLVIAPNPSAAWDINHRLSCSVFGSIPEHQQAELIQSNDFSVSLLSYLKVHRHPNITLVNIVFVGHLIKCC